MAELAPIAIKEAVSLAGWIRSHPRVLAAAAALVVAAFVGGWVVHHLMAPAVQKAQAGAETAADGQAARGLEAQGERATAGRVQALDQTTAKAKAATLALAAKAGAAPDATTPLAADRALRLRADDDQLCALRPGLCAGSGPAAAAAAAGGDAGLQPRPPARAPDGG